MQLGQQLPCKIMFETKILLKVGISKFRRTQTLAIDKKQKTFLKSIIPLQKLWRKRKIKSVDRKRSHNNSESDKY